MVSVSNLHHSMPNPACPKGKDVTATWNVAIMNPSNQCTRRTWTTFRTHDSFAVDQPFLEVSCHHIRPTTVDVEATQKQSSNSFSPTWGRWLAQRWTMVNLCLWLFWMHMTLGLPACVAGPTKDRASRASRASIWTCGNQREMETSRQLQWTVYFCFARLGYRKGSHFLRVLVPMYIYIY